MNNKQQPLSSQTWHGSGPLTTGAQRTLRCPFPGIYVCTLTRGNVATEKKKKRGRLEVETFAIIKIKCLTRRWQLAVVVVVIMKRLSLTATLPFPSPFFLLLSPVVSNLCINLIEFAAPFVHSQRKREREREKQRTHRERRIK